MSKRALLGGTGLLLLQLLIAPTASAQGACEELDPPVRDLLERLAEAGGRLQFSGIVTLQRGGDMQIVEVTHSVENGEVREKLSRITGQDVQVQRSGHRLGCLHPGHEFMRSGSGTGGADLCELARHYRFQLMPGEPVAGREALRLRVEPKDMYRFGYLFDLDRETVLLLRSTTIASDQQVLEQYQFASLDIGEKAAATQQSAREYEAAHPHPDEGAAGSAGMAAGTAKGSTIAWDLSWIPAGFVATDSAGASNARKSYTDGLASFSVFLERLSRPLKPGEGVERQGSTVAYTRGLQLRGEPVLVTVLGEIPTNTARMVADAVRIR